MAGRDEFLQNLSDSYGDILGRRLPADMAINGMGPYPLARDIDFPGTGESGELLVTIDGATVSPVRITAASGDVAKGTATFTVEAMQLAGTYDIYGIEQPKIELDIGGGLKPLALLAAPPSDDDDTDPPSLTEQQFDQLQQANDQKARLSKTANGRDLLSTYSKFNDDYNYVFQTNTALRQCWPADGATAQMADHTSAALKNGSVVNPTPEEQEFGDTHKTSYNKNSFNQAVHLIVACNAAKKPDAALAVSHFTGRVTTDTKNSATNTNTMTGDDVYDSVANAPSEGTPVLAAEVHAPLMAAVQNVCENNHDDGHLQTISDFGLPTTPETIANIQAIHAEGIARAQPDKRVDLWQGPVGSKIAPAEMTFQLEDEPDGHLTARLVSSTLSVDALDIDSSDWAGDAGDAARSALESARFLHGLVQDRINTAIKQAIADIVAEQAG